MQAPATFPHRPAAFLLDMDGTLADTEPMHWESALAVMEAIGLAAEDFPPAPPIGWSERGFWRDLHEKRPLPEPIAQLVERRSEAMLEILERTSLKPLPGVVELLCAAEARGIPRIVVSGSPRPQIEAVLRGAGLAPWIEDWVSTCDDTQNEKPHPEGYQRAAQRLGVNIRDCVALEDSLLGARAARAAGAFTVLIPSVPHPLEGHEADLILESLEHLPFPVGR